MLCAWLPKLRERAWLTKRRNLDCVAHHYLKPLLRVNIWSLSLTLGDDAGVFAFTIRLVAGVITLGAGLVMDVVVLVSTLGSPVVVVCFVAQLNIWVS